MLKPAFRALCMGLVVLALAALPIRGDYQLGLESFKKGDYKRAIEEFNLEIQKHPNYDYGHFMLGVSHLKLKQHDQALTHLKKAAELDKEKLVYHANLAQAYTELKQWGNVVKALEGRTTLRATPDVSAQAHFLLGYGYFNTRQYAKAVEQLSAAKKLTPTEFKVLSPLGVALYLEGGYDEAISTLSAAAKLNPKHSQTNQYLGEAYLAKAQRETGAQKKKMLYQSATKFAEENARLAGAQDFEAANLLGRAYLGSDRFKEAVDAFEKAIQLNPKHAYAHVNRGEAFKGLKDWKSAVAEYEKAAEVLSNDPEVLGKLAYAYEQVAKDPADAGASLDRALSAYNKANSLKPKAAVKDAIARVQQNIQIREDNKAIAAENAKIEEENTRRQAEYEAKLKEQEEYEKRRKQYLEDKGLVEKGSDKPASGGTPSASQPDKQESTGGTQR